MRKVVLTSCLFILCVAFCLGLEMEGEYFHKQVKDLPAGSTVQITISSEEAFTVDGSTTTSYTYNYIVPREDEVTISSENVHINIHGRLTSE